MARRTQLSPLRASQSRGALDNARAVLRERWQIDIDIKRHNSDLNVAEHLVRQKSCCFSVESLATFAGAWEMVPGTRARVSKSAVKSTRAKIPSKRVLTPAAALSCWST